MNTKYFDAKQTERGIPYSQTKDVPISDLAWWSAFAKKYGYTEIKFETGIYYRAEAPGQASYWLSFELQLSFAVTGEFTGSFKRE